jgi:hypothetical protein
VYKLKWVALLNLILGFYNLYIYVNLDLIFNLIVGSLNIGVWVFAREPIKKIINNQNNN